MRSWPHGQFGDCLRLINVKMERVRPRRTIMWRVTAGRSVCHSQQRVQLADFLRVKEIFFIPSQ